eukprot:Skav201451  [mRNA]  locus=scaffold6:239839:240849:+ [translate_table: standard]
MARATHRKRSIQTCCLLLFLAIFLRTSPCGFARTPQRPLSEVREQTGRAFRKSAGDLGDVKLSPEEMKLVTKISRASEKRDWSTAKSVFGAYSGSASPVYAATMHAAWRCRMNKEGAKIYESCCANCKYIGPPAYSSALRIFGKLQDETMLQQIWDDALGAHDLNEYLSSARIAAAADTGNITVAAETLDLMNASNLSIDVNYINSAMRACWGWGDKQHKAAKYFFDLISKFKLTPNVVSFTSLLGTYFSVSLREVLSSYKEMKKLGIEPDTPFVETYIFTLLQKSKDKRLEEQVRKQSTERLRAVRDALDEFKRAGVPLSGACKKAERELTRKGF